MAIPYERAVLEDLNTGYGDVSVTMPGGGTATGTKIGLHSWTGVLNATDFGASEANTDNASALAAAYAALPDHDLGGKTGTIYLPKGVYRYGTSLAQYGTNFRIVGDPGTVLHFTGAGVAFDMDGSADTSIFGSGLENVTIRGNASATIGLRVNCCHHGRFVNVRVEDVTTTAFQIANAVCNTFENLRYSDNENTNSPNAVTGINLYSGSCSANTFINPIIEGVSGNGIESNGGVQCVFQGGTSEGNAGGFVVVTGGYHTVTGMDCEANTVTDYTLSGSGTTLVNCLGASGVTHGGLYSAGGYANAAIGCRFHNITVTSAAHGLLLLNSLYSVNGASPSGSYSNACADGTVVGCINGYSAARVPITLQNLATAQVVGWDDGAGTVDTSLYRSSAGALYTPGSLTAGGAIQAGGAMYIPAASVLSWVGRSRLSSAADGVLAVTNAAGTGFTQLALGPQSGTTPTLRVVGTRVDLISADLGTRIDLTTDDTTAYGDFLAATAGKGVVLKNAAGTVTRRVRLNDAGDGLLYESA